MGENVSSVTHAFVHQRKKGGTSFWKVGKVQSCESVSYQHVFLCTALLAFDEIRKQPYTNLYKKIHQAQFS